MKAHSDTMFCLVFSVVLLILLHPCDGKSNIPSAFLSSALSTKRGLLWSKIDQQRQQPEIRTKNERISCHFPSVLLQAATESGGDDTTATKASNDNEINGKTDIWNASLLNGLKRMSIIMNPEYFASQSPLLKQLQNEILKNVQIKESSIPNAGLGLFATKNIKAGTIVGFYPAHALGLEDATTGKEIFVCDEADKEHFQSNPHATSGYLHATDQPIFNRPSLLTKTIDNEAVTKNIPLYLDVNPNHDRQTGSSSSPWVSHYINDGASLNPNSGDDDGGVSAYYTKSTSNKNCIHIPFGPSPIIATISTKKIKKGQELFTSYGCVYWLGGTQTSPAMTAKIQQQIQASAQDLFGCMNTAKTRYAQQIEALENAFDEIVI